MPEINFLSLDVNGHANSPVPNRFLKQAGESRALAVILPGLRYSCDNPLLYYTTELFIDHSIDVLQLWANYNVAEFQSRSDKDQLRWMVDDASALIAAGRSLREYDRLILVGKSIGTLTLGALFGDSDTFKAAHAIWFTPLMRYPVVARGLSRVPKKSLCLAGTADRAYDASSMAQACLPNQSLVIDGADHSLQIPGDLPRSLDAMKKIVIAVEAFINSALAD